MKVPMTTPVRLSRAAENKGLGGGLCAALACFLAAWGCGNYSNEDLEFMNAIPQRGDVTVELPVRASLTAAGAADAWQTTFNVTRDFNAVADAFLSLIDMIRSTYPTARDANQRIWGPFASKENPGWQVEFRMTKIGSPAQQFAYVLVMLPPAGVLLHSGQPEIQIIGGNFDAAGGVRVGRGVLSVTLDVARQEGLALQKLENLRTLSIDYSTRESPRHVTLTLLNIPTADPVSAVYKHQRWSNGDGTMEFSFVREIAEFEGPQTLLVESRWLGTGRGRSDFSVQAGTAAGLATSTECWNENFRSTYKVQSWVPDPMPGDPETCIAPSF